MNVLDRINQFIRIVLDTVHQIPRVRIWLPLIAYALIQWLALYAHVDFLTAPFHTIISVWINFIAPEQQVAFTHYPQHYLLLGYYAGWAKLGLGLILESLVLLSVSELFHKRFSPHYDPSRNSRSMIFKWLNIVVIWIVLNGAMLAVSRYVPELAAPMLDGPRRLITFSFVLMPCLYVLLFALLFTAIPAVAMYGENALVALGRSLKLFSRRPMMSLSLAIVVLSAPILLGAISGRPTAIVNSFKPELIYWLLVLILIVEMIANFFWMGTAVRLLSQSDSRSDRF